MPRNQDEIRQREISELEKNRDRMDRIAENPNNIAVAGKGFLADPVTGELVPDQDQVIRATAEARKVSNDLRRAYGVEQAEAGSAMLQAIWAEVDLLRPLASEVVQLRRENDELRYRLAVAESPSGRVAIEHGSRQYTALPPA